MKSAFSTRRLVPSAIVAVCVVLSVTMMTLNSLSNVEWTRDSSFRLKRVPVHKGGQLLQELTSQSEYRAVYKSMPPYHFNLTISNLDVCEKRPVINILIFAYTKPSDKEARQTIRTTWGNSSLQRQLGLVVMFPLGLSTNELQHSIELESLEHGDIIQANFLDTYQNLTYKGITIIEWTYRHCPNAKFILKVDVDVFVNVFSLVPTLLKKYSTETHFLLCEVLWRSKVLRPPLWCGKWCVEKQDYKDMVYPAYCSGSVYVISSDLISEFHDLHRRIPLWWIADVYMTGILPYKMNKITHLVLKGYLEHDQNMLQYRSKFNPESLLFGFINGTSEVKVLWDLIHKHYPEIP